MEKYNQSIAKLKQTEFNVKEVGDDYIKGILNNSKSGILQISTSYSSGWKAYVDGKETEVIKVNTGFIGIPLEEGIHEIYFVYSTPWINLGVITSILGILGLITIIIKQRKRK